MRGEVATGYGRGGKKLGVPTANLPESLFADSLRDVPPGVYFGWAEVARPPAPRRRGRCRMSFLGRRDLRTLL